MSSILEINLSKEIDSDLITVRNEQNEIERSAVYVDTELLNE